MQDVMVANILNECWEHKLTKFYISAYTSQKLSFILHYTHPR